MIEIYVITICDLAGDNIPEYICVKKTREEVKDYILSHPLDLHYEYEVYAELI